MSVGLLYDNIHLPKKVSEILEDDFCIMDNVGPVLVKAVTAPVKFSAYTSIYVKKGSCKADINLITYKIDGPAIVNIPSTHIMQPYEISEDFEAGFVVMSKRLTDAILTLFNDVSIMATINSHPIVPLTPRLASAMDKLYEALKETTTDDTTQYPFQTVLYTLVSFFYRFGLKCYDVFKTDRGNLSANNRITDRFLRLAQEHFRKERFLEYYAERLDITTKHLSRVVRAQTGYSAVEWINRFIVLEAKVMLKSSNLTVQQIAEELNFASQSIFGKFFKKATGVTPKDFRNT